MRGGRVREINRGGNEVVNEENDGKCSGRQGGGEGKWVTMLRGEVREIRNKGIVGLIQIIAEMRRRGNDEKGSGRNEGTE